MQDLTEWPPREVMRACRSCKHERLAPNGAFYRDLRFRARITLTDMARHCDVTPTHLSLMERGIRAFLPRFAEIYEKQCDRRRPATPLPPGRSPRHGRE